ncbi:MAG: hypothetical protein WDN25_25430 [Acetobacteraceae bacterium]
MPPTADPTTTPPPPSASGRLRALLRKLIDYGRDLVATLRQPTAAGLPAITRTFGTQDIARILARITHGLLMAGALEDRLVRSADRLDAPPPPRAPAKPAATPTHPDHTAAAGRPARSPPLGAADRRGHPPSPDRAVIADICRDLGIRPDHPLWQDVRALIIRYGGNLARLVADILDRILPLPLPGAAAFAAHPGPAARPPRPP